jgi:DNA-binding GntR family transcriptional regulator
MTHGNTALAVPMPPSLPELAYNRLREAILTGTLAAGTPLRQEELATQLGMSRLPVREALRRLDSEGLVALRPRRGYIVATLDRQEIEDVLELHGTLEAMAGHAATLRRSDDVVADLERCVSKLERVSSRSPVDVDAFTALNAQFHERLLESSGRPFLDRMLRLVRGNAERYTRAGAGMLVDLRESQHEHRDILEAYRAGDAAAVAKLCKAHRDATHRRLLAHLDAQARGTAGREPSVQRKASTRRSKR